MSFDAEADDSTEQDSTHFALALPYSKHFSLATMIYSGKILLLYLAPTSMIDFIAPQF